MVDICIVVLIGLPGSGKTTLSSGLVEYFKNVCKSTDCFVYHAIHVCYDQLIPIDSISYQDDNSQWKVARKKFKMMLQKLFVFLRGLHELVTEECPNFVKRDELVKIVHNEMKARVFIIVDDNMYYRSMRYEYYQLAREYSLGFCQLFLHCDISKALLNNSSRDCKEIVTEDIITRMAERLEPPDEHNMWEKFSLKILSQKWTIAKLEEISGFVNTAIEFPVVASEDDSEMRQESRVICSKNMLHQVDIALRKLVGDRMKEGYLMGLERNELQTLSKNLGIARQHILDEIKKGQISIPLDIFKDLELNEKNHNLQSFLSLLLSQTIKT